ncbi:MAG: hypothetical protein K6F86_11255 [Lachnospiraceae bacterium]|nr:hypothetical protein [Lachnospiraceae bacterium]
MKQETKILLKAVEGEAKYDRQSKVIWRHKELIAPILRMTVPEFEGMSISDIIACIDGTSITTRRPVDDTSAKLDGLDTEQDSVTEKLIRYDTHLKVVNPKLSSDTLIIMLHIDLEVQNDYEPNNPSYPITKRAMYYAARELGGQLGVLTETTDYSKIEKVYSIWICNEKVPLNLRNTITRFSMKKENLKGVDDEPDEYYDLIDVVIVRRGGEPESGTIFEFVDAVYSNNIQKVEEYTDIDKNQEIRKEIGEIMTAGQSLVAQGIEQGIEQGEERGMDKLSELINHLAKQGKTDEILKVTSDPIYRDKMLKAFNLK